MNSKQRVHATLRREPGDRLPVFMWFHPQTAQRIAQLLEIPVSRVAEAMGDDVRQTWVNNNYAMEGIVHLAAAAGENGRTPDQARPILLAAAGEESPHAAAVWEHAAKDCGAPITSRIGEP